MGRENRNNRRPFDKQEKTRYWSVIGFLASITVLSIAFFMSINQEEMDHIAQINNNEISNSTLTASSELSKTINEIASVNMIKKENIVNNETINTETNVPSNKVINTTVVDTNAEAENYNEVENIEKETEKIEEEEEQEQTENKTEEKQEESKNKFIKPVDGEIYKEFSMDSLVYSDTLQEWVTHRGIDIKAEMSADVKASADGTIKSIKNDPRYGWSITIEHNDGYSTVYTCLVNADLMHEGDKVEQGQIIGKVGNSGVFEVADGTHLHFEMIKDGGYVNPEMYIK